MSRTIVVKVADANGYGVYGQKVKTYNGSPQFTGKDGKVTLEIEGSSVSIYINGNSAYNGSTKDLDNLEVFNKSGGRFN